MRAPTGAAALPPATLRVRAAAQLLVREGGRVLLGGSPLRLIRLRPAGRDVVLAWRDGGVVGEGDARRRLARRLLDVGLLDTDPTPAAAVDVTVAVPVRDRPDVLRRCLAAIAAAGDAADIVVVDDGSADAARVRQIAGDWGATVLRRERSGGPAAARNAGLAGTSTPFVAFVDSDVVVQPGWLERLRGHFDDPVVGVVAPRVAALDDEPGAVAAYERRRSSLDMGARPASVGAGRAVPYVPATAIVVRRAAVPRNGFDESLEVGEDVDFCWRVLEGGWRVVYDPAAVVRHEHRVRMLSFLRRRWQYASSIGPLAARHPASLPAARLQAAPTLVGVLLLLGRPRSAAVVAGVAAVRLRGTLEDRCERPAPLAVELTGRSCLSATRGLSHAMRRSWSPALIALALVGPGRRAARRALLLAFVTAAIERRPRTVSEAALSTIDDVVAAIATWVGCARSRQLGPLLPARGRGRDRGRDHADRS